MKRVTSVVLAVCLGGLVFGSSADAQPSAIPADIAAKVRALGPVLNDEVRASARSAYAPLQPKIGPEILVKADISCCGDLDAAVEGDRVWMTCTSGAVISRRGDDD